MALNISTLGQARGRLILNHMFWASLLLSMPMVLRNDLDKITGHKTAATNGKEIWLDPDFVESLPLAVVMFVLAHEAAHVMFMHATRRGDRDPKLWNIACDHAINLILKQSGFTIWERACCDSRFIGMSAEQIYNILQQEAEAAGKFSNGRYSPTPGTNEAEAGDLVYGNHTPEQIREIEQTAKQMLVSAATQAKMAGQLPDHIRLAIDGLINPPQRWERIFQSYMRQVAYEQESWSRRNRRYPNVILPGKWNLKLGEFVVVGDTSGSMMNANIMGQLSKELTYAVEVLRPSRTRLIWADDADCSKQQVFEYGEPIVIKPEGGGGTDMRKPLKFVERYQPLVVLLLTDCHTPWPTSVPYPLIVGSTTELSCPRNLGQTVHLPAGQRRRAA